MTAAVATPKIAAIIRLLASPSDGEALAAVRALGRTLASINADFNDLADAVERSATPAVAPVAQHDQRHDHRDHADWRSVARGLLNNSGAYLSFKERQFLSNISSRFGTLSPRQEKWLADIYQRVAAERRRA